jgi:glucose/arabinose dehydrogenase
MRRILCIGLSSAFFFASCSTEDNAPQKVTSEAPKAEQTKAKPSPEKAQPAAVLTKLEAIPTPERQPKAEVVHIRVQDAGFATPESVLHDPETDTYLVSNINGDPLENDENGFISRIKPDGSIIELKWIDGEKEGVDLNAPKGMAIFGGTLYVADLQHVRTFDRRSGKPTGAIRIKDSTFLNDLVASKDGRIFVSDSGLTTGLEPSGSDAVYEIDRSGAAKKIIEGADLGHPNGLLIQDEKIWVVSFGSGELFSVGKDGKKADLVKTEKGQLDGIIKASDGEVFLSSWEAKAIYKGPLGGPFEEIIKNVEAPADIGFDSRRNRLLIPLFNENVVLIRSL